MLRSPIAHGVLVLLLAFVAVRAVETEEGVEAASNARCLLQVRAPNRSKNLTTPSFTRLTEFETQYNMNNWGSQIYGKRQSKHALALIALDSQHQPERSSLASNPHLSLIRTNGSVRLLHHHIWKNGGTHLCEMAHDAGLNAPWNEACHRFRDESKPPPTTFTHDTSLWTPCAAGPDLGKTPFEFVGHECPIDSETMTAGETEGFRWIEVLRDPVEQAVSWFEHMTKGTSGQGDYNFSTVKDWSSHCNEKHECGFFTFVPNLQTRWLAGGDCNDLEHWTERYDAPKMKWVEEHCLNSAMENLRRMAVILEQKGNSLFGTEKLSKLGWEVKQENRSEYVSHTTAYIADMSKMERAWLTHVQTVDIKLIQMARDEGLI